MNVALPQAWTIERFLAWLERQPRRHDFDGVRPIAMVGGTAADAAIQRNLLIALGRGCAARRASPLAAN